MELRIDRLTLESGPRELEAELSAFARRAVITVRSRSEGGGFEGSEADRLDMISRLAKVGQAYLDIELATAKSNPKWLKSLPKGVERIVSWHDFRGTPKLPALERICEEELAYGSLAKVVTTAKSVDDNVTTLELCTRNPGKAVSFCMGELGSVSRVVSMRTAPLVYASIPNEAVAPGQFSISAMIRLRRMVV